MLLIDFNTPHEQIPESAPKDDRTPEQRAAYQARKRIEMAQEERDLKKATEDLW